MAILELGIHGKLRISVVDGLVDSAHPEEVVLDDEEVEENAVGIPGDTADHGTGHGVEDEVVRGGDDGGQDESGIREAEDDDGDALQGTWADTADGESSDG